MNNLEERREDRGRIREESGLLLQYVNYIFVVMTGMNGM